MSPGASQKTGTVGPPPDDLYVHESIARWRGWGLCAQRPGRQIDRYTNTTDPNPRERPPGTVYDRAEPTSARRLLRSAPGRA